MTNSLIRNPTEKIEWWVGYKDGKIVSTSCSAKGLGDIDKAQSYMITIPMSKKLQDWKHYQPYIVNNHLYSIARDDEHSAVCRSRKTKDPTKPPLMCTGEILNLRLDRESAEILKKVDDRSDFVRKAIKERYERCVERQKEVLKKLNIV